MNIITWNMQGSNATTENKWNAGVKNILQSISPRPIVCLQECGRVPPSGHHYTRLPFAINEDEVDFVDVYQWGGTQYRPGYWVFIHHWDTGANRVNTAIVTKVPPDDFGTGVALIQPTGEVTWRPALGIQLGEEWIFSFHAISPNGPDAPGLIDAVWSSYPYWYIGADWNQQPDDLVLPDGIVKCPPDLNTHSVANAVNKYDYVIRSGGDQVVGARLSGLIMSDHYAVGYGF